MNQTGGDKQQQLTAELVIPFAKAEHASIAYRTLDVDSEPRKELITRKLKLVAEEGDQKSLIVTWSAKEARLLRVSINSFLDHLTSVVETLHEFSA